MYHVVLKHRSDVTIEFFLLFMLPQFQYKTVTILSSCYLRSPSTYYSTQQYPKYQKKQFRLMEYTFTRTRVNPEYQI